jgi:hypothetical protein
VAPSGTLIPDFARRAKILTISSLALALRFARQPKHDDVVRDRKDRNVSRWSPIIQIFSDPPNILTVSRTKRHRVTALGVCLLL